MDNTFPVVVEVDGTTYNLTHYNLIELIKEHTAQKALIVSQRETISEYAIKKAHVLNEVYNFFAEGDWSDGEQTINKGDVNEFLDSIGCDRIRTKYSGTFTITGTFLIEAEDEEEAENLFIDNASVDFCNGDVESDNIEVSDIEETY